MGVSHYNGMRCDRCSGLETALTKDAAACSWLIVTPGLDEPMCGSQSQLLMRADL